MWSTVNKLHPKSWKSVLGVNSERHHLIGRISLDLKEDLVFPTPHTPHSQLSSLFGTFVWHSDWSHKKPVVNQQDSLTWEEECFSSHCNHSKSTFGSERKQPSEQKMSFYLCGCIDNRDIIAILKGASNPNSTNSQEQRPAGELGNKTKSWAWKETGPWAHTHHSYKRIMVKYIIYSVWSSLFKKNTWTPEHLQAGFGPDH